MACLRLVTFLPEPPDRSVPVLRSCMVFSTFLLAPLLYFLPPFLFSGIVTSSLAGDAIAMPRVFLDGRSFAGTSFAEAEGEPCRTATIFRAAITMGTFTLPACAMLTKRCSSAVAAGRTRSCTSSSCIGILQFTNRERRAHQGCVKMLQGTVLAETHRF
jgi:hypothetical protein